MRLQRATRLAIYAVLELAANPGRPLSSGDIAGKYGVSAHHLMKVLPVLAREGMVEATRGVGGGYRFTANPRRTTLYDIIVLFEDLEGAAPTEAGTDTPIGRALEQLLVEIDEITVATVASVTISTMLKMAGAPGGADAQDGEMVRRRRHDARAN